MVNIATFVLDDDPDVLDAVGEAIKRTGLINYKLFTNWGKFVDGLTEDIHVVVIDHLLTEKTGLDILKIIKQKNDNSFVIVYTGYTKEDTIIDYMNNNANRWVKKSDPRHMELLIEYIQQGLQTSYAKIELIKELKAAKEQRYDTGKV